ncbi:MAG: 2-hydroxyacyl-CoA dehydratase family protein [Dehalococcoidia bacterium]
MAEKYQLQRNMYEFVKGAEDPLLKMSADWLGTVLRAVDEGKPIVYHPFSLFSELFVGLDIQSVCCEMWAVMGREFDAQHVTNSIDAAHEAGIPEDLCTFDKAIIGGLILEKMPPPTMIVLSAMPCQSSIITYQAVALLTGAPMWTNDSPYHMDQEGALDYWVKQFKGLISFLEEHSGKKMDYDRLREVVEESNRCVEYWLEAMEFQKLKPTPRSGPFGAGTLAGMTLFGSPSATAGVKALLDDIRDRVAKGETAVPDEKARVIWFHFPIGWDRPLMDWMNELGAVVPYVEYDDYRVEPIDTSTPEKMIRGMAWRALQAPMGKLGRGAFDDYIEDLKYVVDEWKGDCVIVAAHPGCKWITGAYGLIRDACRECGVPLLLYDVDLVDPRVTSAEESRTRIEQFLSTVITR